MSGAALPSGFRKLSLADRRAAVMAAHPAITTASFGSDPEMVELADVMVESSLGYLALPLGLATGVLVDGAAYNVPMATEEPSVIAAAGYGAAIVSRAGGFQTRAGETVTTGQLFVERCPADAAQRVRAAVDALRGAAAPLLERMTARGGGWRGMDVTPLSESGLLRVQVHVDVCDAMGANVVNSVMEVLRAPVEELTGGSVVMAILTNAAEARTTTARFSVPTSRLSRAGLSGEEVARRIVVANTIATEDPSRAVTHNKGIMNGVTALAIATGNDTRAVEAAVHSYAGRSGRYRALTTYCVEANELRGEVTLPLPLGTVGGAAGIHPTTAAALEILGRPGATDLARVGAAIGLAQNLAALFALVSEGIQRGHMGLHAERIAWAAGARGTERTAVVAAMRERHEYGLDTARNELARLRGAGRAE
ncbi:MAG: hydroxymethylglutaryl-CoA reductase, degradative [Spirochaetota bacterium]